MVPGEFRKHEVEVGNHLPPEPDDIARFMVRFDQAYSAPTLDFLRSCLASAPGGEDLWGIVNALEGRAGVKLD